MAVCPLCLPWPRTSVTVIPGRLMRPSASRTSSTLLGRTIALINFISALQRPVDIGRHSGNRLVGQLRAVPRDVEDIDRLLPFGRNQHEIDVAAMTRNRPADPVQQPE